ncbi:hypothetical protein BG015_010731, partial [Linnemannia schmuckeri]
MTDSALNFKSEAQSVVKPNPAHYNNITARGAPFVVTHRVNVSSPGIDLRNEVHAHSVDLGEPVVVEGFKKHEAWPADMFTLQYLHKGFGHKSILCADLLRPAVDVRKTMARYLEDVHSESMGFTVSPTARRTIRWRDADRRKPLLYARDQACPHDWTNALMGDIIPPFLAFQQEDDLSEYSPELVGDAMPRMSIGQDGTWMPARIHPCGAMGHNIMTWAEKDSSCVWFIVKAEHRAEAEAMWARLGQDLGQEHYFATLQKLESAQFPIHVVEQRVGDLVIVPSDCVYQFINIGKGSAQVSWSRTTPDCLETAITSVLPRYREQVSKMVGQPERYKIKYIVDMALSAYTKNLAWNDPDLWMPRETFMRAFKQVLEMYKDIVKEDWVNLRAMGPEWTLFEKPKRILESRHAQMTRVCGFCQGDIWNRHFQCRTCLEEKERYHLCTRCYGLGRSCDHGKDTMEFVEYISMESCRKRVEKAVCAWNESTVLAGSPGYEPITESWPVMILPLNDKAFSAASLAYRRRQSVDYRKECHICKSTNTTLRSMHASCAFCPLSFCELCLEAYYEMDWVEIAGKQAGWKCVRCQGWCPCVFDKHRALTSCVPSEDDHRRCLSLLAPVHDDNLERLSVPEPVHDHNQAPSLPEFVRDSRNGDVNYGAEQLIQEILEAGKDNSRQGGNNNDQESLIMDILASATDFNYQDANNNDQESLIMDILASATDGNYQAGNSIEVDFLIQEILESQAGDRSRTEKPKSAREMTSRPRQSDQLRQSSPTLAVETLINVSTSLGKRSLEQTDLGAETKEVKRARGTLDDEASTDSNGSQVAEGVAAQTTNAHPAQRERLMDTNGSNTRKRPLETEIKLTATKKSKVDPSPKIVQNNYNESSRRLTGNMGKASKKKARTTPLAAAIGAKNMLDLGKMRQEQEAARRARISATPMPVSLNDAMVKAE